VGDEIFRTRPDPVLGPTQLTVGTGSFSRGVKRPGRGVDHPFTSSAEVKERVGLYLYSHSWPVIGSTFVLSLTMTHKKVKQVGDFNFQCNLY
jgi:hypothetical protein